MRHHFALIDSDLIHQRRVRIGCAHGIEVVQLPTNIGAYFASASWVAECHVKLTVGIGIHAAIRLVI